MADVTFTGTLTPQGNMSGSLSPHKQLTGVLSNINKYDGSLSNAILRGYSAYQIAVEEGFEGTLEEWIESLKGAEVQMRQSGRNIEWKYSNEDEWKFLLNIQTVSDYEFLSNKPSINGITLSGDLDLDNEYIGSDEVLSNAEIEELLK